MKIASFFLFLLTSQAHGEAFDCKVLEAQVIGNVQKSADQAGACALQVELTFVQYHAACPLHVGERQVVAIEIPNNDGAPCAKWLGKEISGVLQNAGSGYRLDL